MSAFMRILSVLPLLLAGCFFNFERGDLLVAGSVRGQVFGADGEPASRVIVRIANAPSLKRTAEDGRFVLEGISPGTYTLAFTVDADADGIFEQSASRALLMRVDNGVDLGRIDLRRTTTISGVVVRPGGEPVPGARVSRFTSTQFDVVELDNPAELTVTTDDTGAFVLPGFSPDPELTSRVFATLDGVSAALELIDASPVRLELDVGAPPGRNVELILAEPIDAQRAVVISADGIEETQNVNFTAGAGLLVDVAPGLWDLRVCATADCARNDDDVNAFSLPLAASGANARWGPLFAGVCEDCDGDGRARFVVVDLEAIDACGEICAGVYDDPDLSCTFEGIVRDCDDDGDGQPDILEPLGCRGVGQGGDRDADGLCDRADVFPDCANNDDECLAVGASVPGSAALPGQDGIDECALSVDDCGVDLCVDEADGFRCEAIDPCSPSPCGEATCVVAGDAASCECSAGFEFDSGACVDINECGTAPCDVNATCTNTPGAFECACDDGFAGDGLNCTDVDECADVALNECDANAACTNTPGAFQCTCNVGFSGDGVACDDVDECAELALNDCDANALCTNVPGAFQCACNAGFTGDGLTCDDDDECLLADACDVNAACTNVPGSFQCDCNAGYAGDGATCAVDGSVAFCDAAHPDFGSFADEQRLSDTTNGRAGDKFGNGVAVSGDGARVVFGAQDSLGAAGGTDGSAYVFTGSPRVLEEEVFPAVGADIQFGTEVAINDAGDVLVGGAITDVVSPDRTGGAVVFRRSGLSWIEAERVIAADPEDGAQFGVSVALSADGTRLVVGADQSGGTGAAYVYLDSGSGFVFEQKLLASDAETGARFGESVDISDAGDTIIVGAERATVDGFAQAGAAYVFRDQGAVWSESEKLISPEPAASDLFGESVALVGDGSAALVGAPFKDDVLANEGATYVFRGAPLTYVQRLTINGVETNSRLGTALAATANGARLVVGGKQ